MKNGLFLSLAAAVVLGLAAWRAPRAAPQTWEYRLVKEGQGGPGPQVLNTLGAQGWDLVSVVCTEAAISLGGGTGDCWYYLKRPR